MTEHTKLPWRVDPISLWIVSDNVPKGPMHVADVRGWGYLTGKGHGALALTDDEAIAIQAANAALIIQAVNSYPEMREALSEALAYIEYDTDQREADRLIAKIKTALGENEMSDPWELTKKVRDYGYQLLNEAEHSKAVGAKDAQFAATAGAAVIENVLRIIKDYFHDRG